MKHRLPAAALLLAAAPAAGRLYRRAPACGIRPSRRRRLPRSRLTTISEKYGLESPTPHTPPMDMDWGWSVKNP